MDDHSLNSRRDFLQNLAVVATSAALAGCSRSIAAPLRIGGGPNISMLAILADKKGFFRQQGLAAGFAPLQNGKVSFDAVNAGQIDIGILTDANIAFIGQSGLGDVQVLGSIMVKTDDAIIGRRSSNIATPDQLKGKRVAYTPSGTSEVFLDLFLQRNGIRPTELKLMPMAAPAMLAALAHRDVDAVSVWQPFRFNFAKSLGSDAIQFYNGDVYPARILVVAKAGLIKNRAHEIKLLFEAFVKAATFAKSSQSETIATVAPVVGIETQALTSTWSEYHFGIGNTDQLATHLRNITSAVVATEPAFGKKPPIHFETNLALEIQADVLANAK